MSAAAILFGLVAGAALGVLHFGLLRLNTRLYLRGAGCAPLLQAARIAISALALLGVARLGVFALLAAMTALLAVRNLVLHRETAP